ncbi:MAG: excinuclease ABC subunit UvrA [Vampirovibrionales bacterium]
MDSVASYPTAGARRADDAVTNGYSGQSGIVVVGAKTHTLKNLSCVIPHKRLTVITGVSGSGKSSLAFDTLYAEGQRRYVESLSTYARQFLERLEKPDVESITGLMPAVALEQKNGMTNARSTVGTLTECTDYLRALFAGMATVEQTPPEMRWRDEVDAVVTCQGVSEAVEWLSNQPAGTKWLITAPMVPPVGKQSAAAKSRQPLIPPARWLSGLQALGADRWVDAQATLHDWAAGDFPKVSEALPLAVLVDRVVVKPSLDSMRLGEAVLRALRFFAQSSPTDPDPTEGWVWAWQLADEAKHTPLRLTALWVSPTPTLTPAQFSFNHPLGACPACEGYGRIIGLDLGKVIPNPTKSLAEGAIHPFTTPAHSEVQHQLMQAAKKTGIPTNVAFNQLSPQHQTAVLEGFGTYPGVRPFFEWLESKRYKVHVRVMLAKYRGYYLCPDCHGSRLNAQANRAHIQGVSFGAVQEWPLHEVHHWLDQLSLPVGQGARPHPLERVRYELVTRLACLINLSLGYLSLGRSCRTLSGGEMQRLQLTAAIGTWLTETLYVFDEPTVGLHARDGDHLLAVLRQLRDLGNTLVVVEHDPDMILGADYVLDLGPEAGEGGGRLVFEGSPEALLQCQTSATGRWLSNPPTIERPNGKPSKKATPPITIVNASGNNLQHVTVSIPTGKLVCVSGVSGSGKSTLIKHTLYTWHQHRQGKELDRDLATVETIEGLDAFSDVVLVDQSPLGRSSRSNPATYVGAWEGIRKRFGGSRAAKAAGLSASDFSFNRAGGRCERCEGLGTLTIDMQFLADVTMTCPDCNGQRFGPKALSLMDLGAKTNAGQPVQRSIADVLNLTITDAIAHFAGDASITQPLQALMQLGLGYLRLGQSTATLSGGECQRLKLASYLTGNEEDAPTKRSSKTKATAKDSDLPVLFLFDEPTTGLHLQDIGTLVAVFRALLAQGHSVVVIEHHLALLAQADWLIDMGPEGGDDGGRVVYEGPVITKDYPADSHTLRCLARYLGGQHL